MDGVIIDVTVDELCAEGDESIVLVPVGMEAITVGVTVNDRNELKVPSIPEVADTLEDDDTEGCAELVTDIVASDVIEGLPLIVGEFVTKSDNEVIVVDVDEGDSDILIFAEIVYEVLIELLPLTLDELVNDKILDTDHLEDLESEELSSLDCVTNDDFETDAQAERECCDEEVREIRADVDKETVTDGERDVGGVIDDAADFEKKTVALKLRSVERERYDVRVPLLILLVPVGIGEFDPERDEYRLKVDGTDTEGEDDDAAVLDSMGVFVLKTDTVIVFVSPVDIVIDSVN